MSPSKSDHRESIAIVGMACRFPHAKDLSSLWRVISTGEVTFEDIDDSRWKHSAFFEPNDVRAVDKTYVRKGAFIEGVDEFAALHYGLAPRRVQVMDPQHRICIEATRQALQDAGYDQRGFDRARTGVFIGASVSEYKDLMTARHRAQQAINGEFGDSLNPHESEALKAAVADVVPGRAFTIAGSLLNMIACSVAQTFDLNGPALSIDAACSSALVAIHEATVNLRARQINVAIAGGVYLNLNPDNLIGFSRIGAISPSGACRPFDAKADGFVMGEGVGLVVLKRLDDAIRDGDRVYAVLKGSGCNNDGRGEGPMTPRAEGQRDAMWRAHADADFPVETISYVETHGTATTVGDVVEVGALKHFFNERAGRTLEDPFCNLGSIKGNIGHTMSAAGVAGFIKTCLILHHGVIPPQPGVEEINPKLDLEHSPFHVARESKPWDVPLRRAAVSSFGFGGTNAHVLLEQAPVVAQPVRVAVPELFLLSAPTHALLQSHAAELGEQIALHALEPADVARTLASRQGFDSRVAFLATTRDELITRLGEVATGVIAPMTPVPADQRQLAFLFAGQGAQKTGLLKDLVDRFPMLRAKLEQHDAAVKAEHGFSLINALYPPAGTDLVAAQKHLTQTHVCQPAMAALGIALGELLIECGITPTHTLGHSLGEFAAASIAGMLPAVDAVKLVARRGALMDELNLTDPGAMLAVMAERSAVEKLIDGLDGVVVANHNHPTQVVLSGTTKAVELAQAKVTAAGLKSTRLDVSHAFHSPLMAGMDVKMQSIVAALALQEPGRHGHANVASCISGRLYGSAAEAKEIWVSHATSPVNFVDALQTCVDAGATHFIQVGAGGALLSFARGVSPNATVHALAPNEGADGGAMLLTALGQLWVKGAPLNAAPLFAGATFATLPPTPLEVQKYWAMERTPRAPRPQTRAAVPQMQMQFQQPTMSMSKGPVAMDNLIALFQQQMALLQSQTEIVKAQAQAIQAMAGGAVDTSALTTMAQAMPVQAVGGSATAMVQSPVVVAKPPDFSNMVAKKATSNGVHKNGTDTVTGVQTPAPRVEEKKPDARPHVQKMVLEAVARISAFPLQTLKLEQTLVGELGFDSLMLVELDQSVGKAFPAIGGLPRELFSKTTSSVTIIDHLVNVLEKGTAPAAAAPTVTLPLERYVPTVVPAPLAALSETVLAFDRPLLITKDGKGLAEALVAKLKLDGVNATIGDATTAGDFGGVIHLVNGDADFRTASRTSLALAKKLGNEKAELFVTVTSLGGGMGMTGNVARESLGQVGALGFTKALAQEWPDALVKAIDVDAALGAEAIAQNVVDEIASGDRSAEIGFTIHGRNAVSLQVTPASASVGEKGLDAKSVVVITGGAKGLGFKFAKGLAKSGVTLALTGRSAMNEELSRAIAQLQTAGAKAVSYTAMNVRDAASVKTAIDSIRTQHGRIDVVVHNAGLLADALIEKKDVSQLDSVLETKVGGALALIDATSTDSLSLMAFIGSWAGRFGNAAQTDYSAANAMLSRVTAIRAPGSTQTRTLAIDFPPWEDSEMVKKIPAFKKAELKADGVTFLSDDEGVKAFLNEVKNGVGEVLVGRALPERTVLHRSNFPVSRLNHVYLNDHTMAGQRVLPFAAAIDHVAAAALEASAGTSPGKFTPFAIADFKLQRAVLVPDTIWLEASVKQNVRGANKGALNVTLSQGSAPSYTGTVTVGADTSVIPSARVMAPTPSLPLSLKDFYGGFTFHGPRLQGITSIDALSDDGVVGWVKGCRPADWIKEPLRAEWAVDRSSSTRRSSSRATGRG